MIIFLPQVTVEDMVDLILEKNKNLVKNRLWELELEDCGDDNAKPLLKLVWAVNVANKVRDIQSEVKMLREFPEVIPPDFLHPGIQSTAKFYAKLLREKRPEVPTSKLLSPQEVVMQVVPRVLHSLWTPPQLPLLNMPSQKLSTMSVSVTKAVLDRISSVLHAVGHRTSLSRSSRDETVLSILTEIRRSCPHDVLMSRTSSFAPVLLSNIVDVAAGRICELFQPQSLQVPTVQPPASTQCQDDVNPDVTEKEFTEEPDYVLQL